MCGWVCVCARALARACARAPVLSALRARARARECLCVRILNRCSNCMCVRACAPARVRAPARGVRACVSQGQIELSFPLGVNPLLPKPPTHPQPPPPNPPTPNPTHPPTHTSLALIGLRFPLGVTNPPFHPSPHPIAQTSLPCVMKDTELERL